jgi:translation initiation factor 5
LEDVAAALRVPSESIIKYLCAELGANKEGSSIIKGSHTYDMMIKQLTRFIEKYVICRGCKYPELRMFIEGKNDLKSRCNSCGVSNTHDGSHKAGKALIAHYKDGGKQKMDITKKKMEDAEDHDDGDHEEKVETKKSKKEEDISDIDDELTPASRRVQLAITAISTLLKEKSDAGAKDKEMNNAVLDKLDSYSDKYGISVDFMHYISFCAVFPPKYNICKHWEKHEDIFIDLVKREGKIGIEHFMQSIMVYFIRVHNKELGKYIETFLHKLVQQNVLNEKFLIDWADKNVKLDKDSGLYDKKADRKFRESCEKFIEFLKNQNSSDGSDSESDEETAAQSTNDNENESEKAEQRKAQKEKE